MTTGAIQVANQILSLAERSDRLATDPSSRRAEYAMLDDKTQGSFNEEIHSKVEPPAAETIRSRATLIIPGTRTLGLCT